MLDNVSKSKIGIRAVIIIVVTIIFILSYFFIKFKNKEVNIQQESSINFELVDTIYTSYGNIKIVHDNLTDNLYLMHNTKAIIPYYDSDGTIMKYDTYIKYKGK